MSIREFDFQFNPVSTICYFQFAHSLINTQVDRSFFIKCLPCNSKCELAIVKATFTTSVNHSPIFSLFFIKLIPRTYSTPHHYYNKPNY